MWFGLVERKIKYYALESTDVLNKLAGPEAAWYVLRHHTWVAQWC